MFTNFPKLSQDKTQETQSRIMVIDPGLAESWLKKRDSFQRPVSKKHVSFIKRQLVDGKWIFNGESIKFSTDDTLIDGQHRLTAVVETGISIRTIVVFNVQRDAYHVIDQGKSRRPHEVLAARGHSNYTIKASIAAFVLSFKGGRFSDGGGTKIHADNTDIIKWVEETPYTDEMAAIVAGRLKKAKFMTSKEAGGLHFLFAEKDKEKAEIFFDKLTTGVGLEENSPILLLRNRMQYNAMAKAKLPMIEKSALYVKAWNKFREGKAVKSLRWNSERGFPEIK